MAEALREERHPIEPWDEHNRRLVDHVHPPDWQNPEPLHVVGHAAVSFSEPRQVSVKPIRLGGQIPQGIGF